MAERNWTEQQKQAIEARGGTILVSAAAGSGKTAVLVERVVKKITDNVNPCDADRLLIVTFTNAAASEMRERIAQRVSSLIAEDPMNLHLQRQQILLQNAHISTIHSFCLDLIRENFEKLEISPDFRIADENEIHLLSREVLTQLLEEKYAGALKQDSENAFLKLTEVLGAGRDDSQLEDTIFRLYRFIRSLPDPEGWLDDKLIMYHTGTPFCQTPWGKSALRFVDTSLKAAVREISLALDKIRKNEQLMKAYGCAFESDLNQLIKGLDSVTENNWDILWQKIHNFEFQKLGPLRKFEDDRLKEEIKSARESVKENIKKLQTGILCCSEKDFNEDTQKTYPLVENLFGIVLEFDKRLYRAKSEKNILDFSDLEHLVLKLLVTWENGKARATPTARAVASRFEEVLVDEYQDTSPIQDTIFSSVSQKGRNLFMVGDVKQSIYRFRQAMPELFIEKKEKYAPFNASVFPAKIILGRNFRSREGVTSAVNFIFRQLMSKEFGEIDYDSEEELIPAASYEKHDGADFALHIVDTTENDENSSNETLEARHIAAVIKKMLADKTIVTGEKGLRPVTCRDFCILLRSTNGHAQNYIKELEVAGIPAYADITGGYLDSYEVSVMISLLRILDNPLQDVPLLSVMLSPVFGFTPDDLANIRVANRKDSLYLALTAYARENGGRFGDFIQILDNLRRMAVILPADRLILRIYEDTGFLQIYEAMTGGEARRANLRLLLDYARNYEAAGYKGLSGFIRFIDRIGEQAGDLSPASAVSENADVVRIMSIHKSKGLEFPICILAGCARRFNKDDLQRPALFHPIYGFGSIVRERNCRFTTLPREVVKMETEKSGLSEEMRVLYVAMTRAKEKLIAVMTLSHPRNTVIRAASMINRTNIKLDPFHAAQSQSMADWLLACALRHPSCRILRRMSGLDEDIIMPCDSRWNVEIVPAESESISAQYNLESEKENQTYDPKLLEKIKETIEYVYPYRNLSGIPSKISVSELAKKEDANPFESENSVPNFVESRKLTPAQAGTALHRFMQDARLETLSEAEDICNEVTRLVNEGFLSPEEGDSIDPDKVKAFLESALYARIRNAQQVWKEFRFNILMDAGKFNGSSANGESIVIQGIADIVFKENGEYYIADYKTDNANEFQLRERYTAQLQIYAYAVAQIMGQMVNQTYIYGFKENKTIII